MRPKAVKSQNTHMALAKHSAQFEALKAAIAAAPSGASLEQLGPAATALGISRNTLIRRLAEMVEAGQITKSGATRSARYHAIKAAKVAPSIPLSEPAAELLKNVGRPIAARTPVAYNRDFLSSYRPNETYYLPEADRARLRTIGTPSQTPQAAGTYAQAILSRLLIDLSWNSSRMEGNTYSLLETKRLLDFGEETEGKGEKNAQMILNHKDAIEFLVSSADEIAFNRYTLLNLHALLANNLLDDPAGAGRVRREPVAISGSVYYPPEVPQLIDECLDQILQLATAVQDPFEQAFFIMVHVPYLQPFIDVNKRVSRLAANISLIKDNLSPLSFVEVPNDLYTSGLLSVYELNRIELLRDVFIWAYERSSARYVAIRQTLGEPDKFRLRYRTAMREVIAGILREPMGKKDAASHIDTWARSNIAASDQPKFIETVETELLSLHEGNFARYQVRPSEFAAWQSVWTAKSPQSAKAKKV